MDARTESTAVTQPDQNQPEPDAVVSGQIIQTGQAGALVKLPDGELGWLPLAHIAGQSFLSERSAEEALQSRRASAIDVVTIGCEHGFPILSMLIRGTVTEACLLRYEADPGQFVLQLPGNLPAVISSHGISNQLFAQLLNPGQLIKASIDRLALSGERHLTVVLSNKGIKTARRNS
ncbi:MAG TPA: hypothetical protein V6C72_06765 [Chroococcales cyanobacterium]